MPQDVARDDPRADAVHRALAPYAWERLSAEMLARRVVAALDRHWLDAELRRAGRYEDSTAVEPASVDDERTGAVVRALQQARWRALTLPAVCRIAVAALDAARRERAWRDIERALRLDA